LIENQLAKRFLLQLTFTTSPLMSTLVLEYYAGCPIKRIHHIDV
jgi:hypothetical protein